jgi:hypothetical protein
VRRERDQGRRRRQGRRPEAPERRVGLGPPLSRGCACLSLTARLSTLGCWSGGFCRRSTLQPPWGVAQATPQSNPRRPRRRPRQHRVTQLRGGRGPCRWNCKTSNPVGRPGSGGVRRPTVSASAPRFLAAGRRYRQPEPPGPACAGLKTIQGMFGIITPGQGGFRSWRADARRTGDERARR